MDASTAFASASERCRIPLQRLPSTTVITLVYVALSLHITGRLLMVHVLHSLAGTSTMCDAS